MKRRIVITIVGTALLALAVAGGALIAPKINKPAKSSGAKVAVRYKFPTKVGNWISPDPYTLGEAAEDTETAGGQVGFDVVTPRLLDTKYRPVVRVVNRVVKVIYPNGVILNVAPLETTQSSEAYYQAYVNRSNEEFARLKTGREVQLRSNGAYPGVVFPAGYTLLSNGDRIPAGGKVAWVRGGLNYLLEAPPEIPQDQVDKIAGSAL